MDSITTAIIAAITAGANSGVTDVAKKAIADGYETLKNAIKRRLGADSQLVDAITQLEEKPESEDRQQVVQKSVAETAASTDPDILHLAQVLIEQIKANPSGERYLQSASGIGIAQASHGSTATVNNSGSISGSTNNRQ